MAQLVSVASKLQRADNVPEHTLFSDQYAHRQTDGRKCICYLNKIALDMKIKTALGWN